VCVLFCCVGACFVFFFIFLFFNLFIFLKKGIFLIFFILAKSSWLFFPLHVIFCFLVLNVMNVQFHIGSCKMITDLILHTVHF
jgi:hypothetical protein